MQVDQLGCVQKLAGNWQVMAGSGRVAVLMGHLLLAHRVES